MFFFQHARARVLALARRSTEDLLCTNKHFRFEFHYQDKQMGPFYLLLFSLLFFFSFCFFLFLFLDALSQLIENFLFGILHEPILQSFREIYCREDSYFEVIKWDFELISMVIEWTYVGLCELCRAQGTWWVRASRSYPAWPPIHSHSSRRYFSL